MKPKNTKVFLSIVLSCRNDNYPNKNGRKLLEFCLDELISNLKKVKLYFEIILIEYNPPKNKKKLSQSLRLIKAHNVFVKFIQVPKVYHSRLKFSDYFPISQELAFNVGIKRSIGKYILTKNFDTILNNYFYKFIYENKLSDKYIYRCPRIDLNEHDFFKKNFKIVNDKNLYNETCGDFILMSKKNWIKIRGWWENDEAYQDGSDSLVIESAKAIGIVEKKIENCIIFKKSHDLTHDKRTNYKYHNFKISMLNLLYYKFISVLILLNLTKRKARVISRDGSKKPILINVYCYDLIRKIKKNKSIVPLNSNDKWGLDNIDLKEISQKIHNNI